MFKVYQDGRPADTSGFHELDSSWSPEMNIHDNFDDAVSYAHQYAYPFSEAVTYQPMELNVPLDMGLAKDCPVMMEVREYTPTPEERSAWSARNNQLVVPWTACLFDDESVKEKLTVIDKWEAMLDDSRNPKSDMAEQFEKFLKLGHKYEIVLIVKDLGSI